jgi:NADP-dependent 3-hydroxy acid dehydrogenase YdfG
LDARCAFREHRDRPQKRALELESLHWPYKQEKSYGCTTIFDSLIVGAGSGLSASLARLFAREGLRVALASRRTDKLTELCSETGARAFACDASNSEEVKHHFDNVESDIGAPDVVVYNASARARGPVARTRCSGRAAHNRR